MSMISECDRRTEARDLLVVQAAQEQIEHLQVYELLTSSRRIAMKTKYGIEGVTRRMGKDHDIRTF